MRLARRALIAALATLVLCSAASAQALRPETDPRNLSPAVGTGGPVAGPTGLFTVYDGQTLRRGEFTFSIAYSNFDRDPGNVDLNEVPLSFNVGLNDHLELFFNTTAWRGIHVNNPRNLSSFYLPNSQLNFGGFLGSGAAVVLAPSGPNVGTIAGTAVFRPAFNQPFVQFPFVGGSAGTFGLTPGEIGDLFGFPGFNAQLGAPVAQGQGNFGAADNFPGVGSVFGSILPGVVLATQDLPPTILSPGITVPVTYTTQPAYLPDAPFINRLWGDSSFTSFVVGAKWRFTGPRNPLGVGIMPFYRFYPDQADDFSGFNQMQRGAGPGGNIGDFGLVLFVDGRLSRSVNVSANLGYVLNSNPKGNFPSGEFTLLDRPDEFLGGIAFDFPINRYIQPVLELRSTQYVGGRTPNAFENSPVDALAGVKLYPRRWMGFGLAYRYHINQQDRSLFEGRDFTATVNQTTNVFVPGRGIVVVPATTVSATTGGFPRGFIESDDANGFIGQFWIGRRNPRPEPSYDFKISLPGISPITLPAAPGKCEAASSDCTPSPTTVNLSANIDEITVQIGDAPPKRIDQDPPLSLQEKESDFSWKWTVTKGTEDAGREVIVSPQRPASTGPNGTPDVTLDFSGATPGVTYTVTVEATYECLRGPCVRTASQSVTVSRCPVYKLKPEVAVSCEVYERGSPIKFRAQVSGVDGSLARTYRWTVARGTIQGTGDTQEITVADYCPTDEVTATVEVVVEGCDPVTVSYTCKVECQETEVCRVFDSYEDLRFNDEKARLDNFAIQLQQEPGSQGYYVAYSGNGKSGRVDANSRAERALNYLATVRGINRSRVKVVTSSREECFTVVLWLCPIGGTPEPQPELDLSGADPRVREALSRVNCPPAYPQAQGGGHRKPKMSRRAAKRQTSRRGTRRRGYE
ncbi:MAG TPA: hypothetical protein VD861_04715 [Pyrinomonadaceae bacterium]|nr:hypothetical protein [Pyrinomonadaceae bacterium]